MNKVQRTRRQCHGGIAVDDPGALTPDRAACTPILRSVSTGAVR